MAGRIILTPIPVAARSDLLNPIACTALLWLNFNGVQPSCSKSSSKIPLTKNFFCKKKKRRNLF